MVLIELMAFTVPVSVDMFKGFRGFKGFSELSVEDRRSKAELLSPEKFELSIPLPGLCSCVAVLL